jgi:hypothetical protein
VYSWGLYLVMTPSSVSLYLLSATRSATLLDHTPTTIILALPQAQSKEISRLGTEASEMISQTKSFVSLNCLSQVFITRYLSVVKSVTHRGRN